MSKGKTNTAPSRPLQSLHDASVVVRQMYGPDGLNGSSLTPAAAQLLVAIELNPGLNVTELSRMLNFRNSSASKAIRELLETDLVTASAPSDDARKVELKTNRRGRELAANFEVILEQLENDHATLIAQSGSTNH